ncbi:MAG: hypothetical protein WBD55_02545 [Dehalococcoidia bacterium]
MSMKTLAFGLVSLTLALALAACGDSSDTIGEPTIATDETPPVVTIQAPTEEGTPGVIPSTTPGATPDGSGTNGGGSQNGSGQNGNGGQGGEGPKTPLDLTREELADQFNGKLADIDLLSNVPIAWPDACLGLGEPGETCAQVETVGFRIVLVLGESRYIYRTNESGTDIRLEKVQDFSNVGDDNSNN